MMNPVSKILLVISTTRESPRTIQTAFDRAAQISGSLIALCVIDTELPSSIVDQLADRSFVGEKPGEEIFDEILKEYRQRAEKKLAEIEAMAQQKKIPIQTILIQGDFVSECLTTIQKEKPSLVLIGRKKQSKLSQFIFRSPLRKIEKGSTVPVEVVEE
ncbi:MAG: universal stress protein [Deltaproteobacteria bacterium]|nr:universal stress protein [Deltaproteobacteria bacterium]